MFITSPFPKSAVQQELVLNNSWDLCYLILNRIVLLSEYIFSGQNFRRTKLFTGSKIYICTLLFKSNGIFFQTQKIWYIHFVYRLEKIISIHTKCFAIYVPDLIKFRNCVTAQWLPKVRHVRKTRCKTEMQVSHTKEIPVPATTY